MARARGASAGPVGIEQQQRASAALGAEDALTADGRAEDAGKFVSGTDLEGNGHGILSLESACTWEGLTFVGLLPFGCMAWFDAVRTKVKWRRLSCGLVVARRLAAVGLLLVSTMHAILLASAIPHPTWSAVNALGLAGAVAGTVGLWRLDARWGLGALAGGLALMLGARVVVLATPGAGIVVAAFMAVGLAVALVAVALWAWNPAREPDARAVLARRGLAIVGVGAFANMLQAISTRPLSSILALALGATGWALVAPNVEPEPAHAAWKPAPKKTKEQRAQEKNEASST